MRSIKRGKVVFCLVLVIVSLFTVLTPNVQAVGLRNNDDSAIAQNLYQKMIQAQDQNIDINTFFTTLSPKEQQLVIKILTPTNVEVEKTNPVNPQIYLQDIGTVLTTTMTLRNMYGMTLCVYIQDITWYYDGTYITQPPQCARAGATYMYGWIYNGITSQGEWGGQGYTYFRAYSQASFTISLGGWIIGSWYPGIDQYVYGNGTYSVSTYP